MTKQHYHHNFERSLIDEVVFTSTSVQSFPDEDMSDGASQSTTANVVNVDSDGDVLLVIGTPATVSLRVSLKVLSLALPVFAALFSLRYSEWIALATKSSDAHPLIFPDDDPDAMNLVCHSIHFQENTTVKDIPLPLSQAVA